MSKPLANSPEACIEKFMHTLEVIKAQPNGYYGNEEFDRGMNFIIGLAKTWFCDQVVKEAEPCEKTI